MSILNLGFKNKAGECAKKIMGRNVFGLLNDYGNIPDPDFQFAKEQTFFVQHRGNANSNSQQIQTRMICIFGLSPRTLPDGINIQFHILKDIVVFQAKNYFFNSTRRLKGSDEC